MKYRAIYTHKRLGLLGDENMEEDPKLSKGDFIHIDRWDLIHIDIEEVDESEIFIIKDIQKIWRKEIKQLTFIYILDDDISSKLDENYE